MDHLISFTTPQINTVYGLVHLKYVNVTGKVHPIKGHKGPEGEQRYRSILSLTLALMGVGGQRHGPAALTTGKTRYPLCRMLRGTHGRYGPVPKISTPPGFDPWIVQPVASRYTD